MSSPPILGGASLFTGFTRLCKGLAVVLVAGHIVVQIFPSAVNYLALIPARKPETKVRGDPSDDFAFSSFFPDFLRPVIDPIASIFHRMLCGRFETSIEAHGYTLGGAPLPGSDPIEASRRRERGARALEERLAAERLATARSAEELKKDASENV